MPVHEGMGSCQSNWVKANDSTETINTDALQDFSTSTSYSNVIPLTVPKNATRVLVRSRFPSGTATFTTDPVVRLVVTDGNGAPLRIDASGDSDATGVTIQVEDSDDFFTDEDGVVWSDATDMDGYDLKGGTTLYVLIETISDYEDGSGSVDGDVYVLFLN